MAAHLSFKERDEFRLRLRACLRNVGINPNRPGEFLRVFVQSGQGAIVTLPSICKWLQGESLPSSSNMEIVAKICGVCPVWLRTGQFAGEPERVGDIDRDPFHLGGATVGDRGGEGQRY